ncbi:FHA domain-containing protein [Nocardioides sp. R-C-SC26]|uniref:FHA domain-containing protein n=1 Tax=Nocardioides sp. R-C-SC26 TaxID=2870414 RepID=UPI001E61EDA6|nr:FHA domain-containing protein [Nocardioides sp. R-C-SC26]
MNESATPILTDVAPAWSYRHGEWFAVVGPAAVVLMPSTEKARVAALWSMVDDGAGFDAVLDAVLQGGLGSLPGLVLVGIDPAGSPSKILLRGTGVTARVQGEGPPVDLDGGSAITWVEHTMETVQTLSVVVGDHAASPDLPVVAGLVRAGRLDLPPVPSRPTNPPEVATDSVLAAEPGDHVDAAPELAEAPPLAVVPVAGSGPADVGAGEADPWVDELDQSDELAPPSALDDLLGEPVPAEPSPLDAEGDTSNMGAPLPPPMASLPLPPAFEADRPAVPTPPPPPDWPSAETIVPGTPADGSALDPSVPLAPLAPRGLVARLVLSSGESVDVDGVVLIGRAPEASRIPDPDPQLVVVPSPMHEISATHVEIRPGSGADLGSAVVTDLGSTNGTVVIQPGLGAEELKPGIAVQLIPGAVINLGDGITIQVASA